MYRLERVPLDERVDVGGLRAVVERGLEPLAGVLGAVVGQPAQGVDLQLKGVLTGFDRARDVDHVADGDLGVRPNACLLEGGTREDAGGVRDGEDGRTAGLFGLDDFPLDGDLVAGREPVNA